MDGDRFGLRNRVWKGVGVKETWWANLFSGSMRRTLLLIMLAVLIPMLVVQAVIFRDRVQVRRMKEYQSNLEFARVVALGFDRYIRDILRQELALGEAFLLGEPITPEKATTYLKTSVEDYQSVRSFAWVDPAGKVVLSSEKGAIGLDVSQREYVKKIKGGAEWAVSDLLVPLTGGDMSFIIARGIYDDLKQLRGIMIAVIEPGAIPELAFTVKRFEEGATMIFDRQGRAVYRYPPVDLTGKKREAWIKVDPALQSALKGQESIGVFISPADGMKRIEAHVPIRGIGWVAGASRPEAVAMSEVMEGLRYQVFWMIGVGLFSFLLAMVIARRITYQTQLLRAHALTLGEGNLEHKIHLTGITELSAVAEAFNRMAEQIDERKQALAQAAEETQRTANELNAVFNAMVQGVILLDREGTIIKVNPAVIDAFGFDPTGQNYKTALRQIAVCYSDGRPIPEEKLPVIKAFRGSRVIGERMNFTNGQGSSVISLISAIPLYDEEKITGAVLAWQDVTEWENLLLEFRKSEEKYRELVQNANSIIVRLDREGNITFFNEYAQTFFGYAEDEILGRNMIGTIVPETDSEGHDLTGMIDELVKDPELYAKHENENMCRDGRRVWVAWTNRPVYDSDGQIREIFSVGIDVTERKRAEEALKEGERRFRRLVETSTFGLVISDLQGRISYANPAFVEMLGYTWEEIEAGKIRLTELTPAEFRERDAEAVRELEMTGSCTPYEKEHTSSDGRRVPVFVGKSVLERSVDGELVIASYLTDMTRLKQAQEALHRAYDDLEIRIRERTAELIRSNEELTRFAYVASHDLQEPLRMVASYVQLLELRYKDKLDAEANQFIEYAAEGANRMRGMIKGILEYSRVNTQPGPLKPTDCERVLSRAVQNLNFVIEDTNAEITHDPLPTVWADEVQLLLVFQNLIENGIKFRSEQRRPEIHIAAERKEDHWLFSVRDNGIGIEKDYYDHIFVIFKKLHGRHKYAGAGMGLAIVKRIIERHGGTIYVESQPDRGSTFYFTISVR
jgi:PAS domain S-box-containing protein